MKARKWIPAALLLGMLVVSTLPTLGAFHGSWWQARNLPGSSAGFGLNHAGHETSTATLVVNGAKFDADVHWSGQNLGFGQGTMTVKLLLGGVLVHENAFAANEDIANVQWLQCPAGTGDPGFNDETLPTYKVTAAGTLSLGPGAPGGTGMMRNSFCGIPGDAFWFKDFSDYTGTYLNLFALHLHVRGADHG